jgi:hypothetical protein
MVNGFGENFMSKLNYQLMPDAELTNRLEKGEMLSNPDLYVEFLRRMEEHGTEYRNIPEDTARWKADTLKSVHK